MARWLIMQSPGGGSGRPLLAADDVALMHSPPPGVAGGYGQGWQVVTPEVGPDRIEHSGVLSTFSADQVLLPDSGYAFALLYNGHSAFVDTAGIKVGLAALLSGTARPDEIRSTRFLAVALGSLTLGILVRRLWLVLRLRRWRVERQGKPFWTPAAGIVWMLMPSALLAGMGALVGRITGRSFTFWQLSLAMPDVVILLLMSAITGAAVAACRVAALLGRSGSEARRHS